MKKLLLTLLTVVMSCGMSFAVDSQVFNWEYNKTTSKATITGSKETSGTIKTGDVTWNFTSTQLNVNIANDGTAMGVQFGDKNLAADAIIILSTDFFKDKEITSISMGIGNSATTTVDYTFAIDGTQITEGTVSAGTRSTAKKETKEWAGNLLCSEKLEISFGIATGKIITWGPIKITYQETSSVDPDPETPGLFWPKDEYTVEYGQAFESPVLTKVPEDLVVMYVSGNDKVATVDENTGVVTITGVGTTTITAVDEDMVYEAAYTLTVTPINPVLTWSANEYTVTLGKEDEATYPTLTVQPEEVEALVEYSSSNEDVAMIDPASGVIVPMSVGTTVITATVEAYENYAGATKSYTLTVNEEGSVDPIPESDITLQFGDEFNDPKSSYIESWTANSKKSETETWTILGFNNNSNKWDGQIKCGHNTQLTATITTDFAISKRISEVVMTITEFNSNNVNSIKLESSENSDFSTIYETINVTKPTAAGDITFAITKRQANLYYRITFDNKKCNNGKAASVKQIVYKFDNSDPTKESAGLSFGETTTFEVMQGAEFTAPELQNPNGLEVVYASDNESVATVDPTTGTVTIVGAGTATITAASEETDTYNAGSASYTITVKAAANTLAEYIEMAAENNAAAIMNCELIVTYANGAYVFVTDEHHTAYSLIYKFGLGYTKGNVIPAGWDAKTKIYNGLFEIVPVGDMPASVKTAEIGYETVDEFGLADINRVINLENVTVEGESFMTETGQSFTVYNGFSQPTLSSGTYHMTGVVSYYESNVTSTDSLKDANLQFRPIEYRLTADKAATMMVSHASADQKDNDDLYEAIEGDMHNANGSHVFVKFFNIPEGHTVYYRFVNMSAAANVMPLADEDEPAFVEYTGEPVEYNTNGSLEHYTQNAEGVKTEVKSISFSGVTGIEDIGVDGVDAEAVYYNLQGVRVEHPAKGAVYVRVAGNQAVKVLVK